MSGKPFLVVLCLRSFAFCSRPPMDIIPCLAETLKQNETHKSLGKSLLTGPTVGTFQRFFFCSQMHLCVLWGFFSGWRLGVGQGPHPVFRCCSLCFRALRVAAAGGNPELFHFSLTAHHLFFFFFFAFIMIICFSPLMDQIPDRRQGNDGAADPKRMRASRESFDWINYQRSSEAVWCATVLFSISLCSKPSPHTHTKKDLILYFGVSSDSPQCAFWSLFLCIFTLFVQRLSQSDADTGYQSNIRQKTNIRLEWTSSKSHWHSSLI